MRVQKTAASQNREIEISKYLLPILAYQPSQRGAFIGIGFICAIFPGYSGFYLFIVSCVYFLSVPSNCFWVGVFSTSVSSPSFSRFSFQAPRNRTTLPHSTSPRSTIVRAIRPYAIEPWHYWNWRDSSSSPQGCICKSQTLLTFVPILSYRNTEYRVSSTAAVS